jgi:diguanylate cyclase (GGDEF)-like protein
MDLALIRLLVKSAAVTALSVVASLTVVAGIGVEIAGYSLWLPILCPLVIAFPASAFTYWQKQRLQLVIDELRAAQLALQQANEKLAEKVRRDDMTGLLNREAFFQSLEGTRRRPGRGALLLVDADHFKRINDRYGHLVGDDALMEIAAAIGRAVRAGDIVGRIGGEEFGVLLAGADAVDAEMLAERIRAEVEAAGFMPSQGQFAKLTVSVGGTLCGADANVGELMRAADKQLYVAKNGGRNRISFHDHRKLAA